MVLNRLAKAVSVGEEERKDKAERCSNSYKEKCTATWEGGGEAGSSWCSRSRERRHSRGRKTQLCKEMFILLMGRRRTKS